MPTGQDDVDQVAALGVPFPIATSEYQCHFAFRGVSDSLGDGFGAERKVDAGVEGGKAQRRELAGGEFDDDAIGAPGLEFDSADDLVAAFLKKRVALAPTAPRIDNQQAINEDARRAGAVDAYVVLALDGLAVKLPDMRAEKRSGSTLPWATCPIQKASAFCCVSV